MLSPGSSSPALPLMGQGESPVLVLGSSASGGVVDSINCLLLCYSCFPISIYRDSKFSAVFPYCLCSVLVDGKDKHIFCNNFVITVTCCRGTLVVPWPFRLCFSIPKVLSILSNSIL